MSLFLSGRRLAVNDFKSLHTFCVAAYGNSPYIEECLKSIHEQELKSNIIITTSTPSDTLKTLALKFDAEYKVSKRKSGIGRDWNFAYQCAKTQFVTIAHQDDIYHPEYTKSCMAAAIENENVMLFFTDYAQLINSHYYAWRPIVTVKRLLMWPFWFSCCIRSVFFRRLILMFGNPVSCPSVVINKKSLPDKFSFNEMMKTNLDWDAWLELAEKKGAFYRVPKILIYHRIHSGSETSKTIAGQDRETEDFQIFEKLWGSFLARGIMMLYRGSYWLNNYFAK